MGIRKKKQSNRLTTRKREGLLKKARISDSKKRRLDRKAKRKEEKIPASVLRTDEENEAYAEIKRNAQLRKKEYDEKMKNFQEHPEYFESLLRMISRNDVVVEVVDARDPESCRNVEVEEIVREHGKGLVLLMNYTQHVPREVVDGWKSHFISNGVACVELGETGWIECGVKIGVIGNRRSGKNFVANALEGAEIDGLFVSVPPSRPTLSSMLRGCHKLLGVPFRRYVETALSRADRSSMALHFGIPLFEGANEFLAHICERYGIRGVNKGIDSMEAAGRFLQEFSEHRILFWRAVGDGENALSLRFPSQ